MSVQISVPSVGESITEVQVSKWLKNEGDFVARDEPVVELETEKTTLEIPSPAAGKLTSIRVAEKQFTKVGEVLGIIEESDSQETKTPRTKPPSDRREELEERFSAQKEEPPMTAPPAEPRMPEPQPRIMPAARRLMEESGLQPDAIQGSGSGGRIRKEDVLRALQEKEETPSSPAPAHDTAQHAAAPATPPPATPLPAGDEIVPMSPMRLRIAQRLVEAQQTAALLTTFNEIDMFEVVRLRKEYQDVFQNEYGIKLGFMSFFVKASIEALKRFPQVNAEIRGRDIVYHNYYDIGIAIGSGRGLVVPVLRNAEAMSLAKIEHEIDRLAKRVQDKTLTPEELEGGTFTITNGGVYGSLLSTPIINPPQSGILGMHKIEERPVVREGEIVARPMMYVALTYDHRIVDGREAVQFLHHIKEIIEDPSRILLEV